MARLRYTTNLSLDGYIEDEKGGFDWTEPDFAVHTFINDLERAVGTYLYGRRIYETMSVWETLGDESELPPEQADYASVWRAADKVVYSRTLDAVSTPRTRLERDFDTEEVRKLKDASDRDLSVAGAELAQHAFAAGLVDEMHLFVHPVAVGGGKPGLPQGIRADLELVDEKRFANGVVYLRYRLR